MSKIVALRGLDGYAGLGANSEVLPDGSCAPGTTKSCAITPPGVPPSVCWCHPAASASAAAGSFFKDHWGLLAAIGIGGFIVYKVATR